MSALPNNTFANPGNSFYALAGESARNWYQFPSQNGSILLNDPSGTQVLQAIGNDLFYNNELLAKAGDIQNIADWALYPALADVNMNGKNLLDVSSATVTVLNATNINAGGIAATGGINAGISGIIAGGINTNGVGPITSNDVTTTTVTASGNVQAGSVTSTGAVSGSSLKTTGGLDMTNSGITRASSVGISAAGLAPYGALSSPDGVMLTWNGQAITTGGGGNVANWSNYPALTNVDMSAHNILNAANINSTATVAANAFGVIGGGLGIAGNTIQGANTAQTNLYAGATQLLNLQGNTVATTSTGGDSTRSSAGAISDSAVVAYNVTVDRALNVTAPATINMTARNGTGGSIQLNADAGTGVGPAQIGYGAIQLNAQGANNGLFNLGGKIDLTAYSAGVGDYGGATSRVSASAATIALSAGAAPVLPGLAGSMNLFGQGAVSIVASLLPPVLPQVPETIYMYGLGIPGTSGGIRMESPNGIQHLSDSYMGNLYPLDGGGLNIQGRSLPTGTVNISNVTNFSMNDGASVLKTDQINSVSSNGIITLDIIRAQQPIETSTLRSTTSNLTINAQNGYFVEISGADVLAFDPAGTGAITHLQSINGAAWPPPTGDASLWSQYPATSVIDVSGYGLIKVGDISGVTSINGVPYAPSLASDWSLFPALQTVQMATYDISNVTNIIGVTATPLTLYSSSDINLEASNDAYVEALTGSSNVNGQVDVNVTATVGNIVLSATNSTSSVTFLTPSVDVQSANVINVNQLLGAGNGTDLVISNPGSGTVSILDQSGSITLSSQYNGLVFAAGTDINMTSVSGSIKLNAPTIVGQVGFPKNLTVNGNAFSTTDVVSSYGGVTPYSLNTIGGLVAGTSSRFRDATEFYVSSDGSDTSGNGSILAPYQTIQKAITQAELISSAALVCCINVASGHYNENLTFNKGYIIITGSLQSQTGNEVCELTGNISIACVGANDLYNRQVTFQGFNITSAQFQSIVDTSTASHTVTFQDCKCFMNSQFFVSTATCPDMRLYLTNVEISQTNVASSLPVILTNVGLVELERVDITVDGNASAISVTGTSVLSRCSLTTLEITSTAATLAPLLNITSTSTATHSLGNVAFAYTSAVAKTATNAVYIASGIATAILMFNCLFTLTGTASSTNNCVGYNGVGSPTIAGINNASLNVNVLLPQTTSVQSGITQIQYTNIQPPGLASYSSTVDQSIAVAGTPQALTYNTTQFNQGTTLVANSRIYVTAQGNYALNYIVQLSNTSGAAHLATTFLKKNGALIASTGSQWTLDNAHEMSVAKENIVSLNAGDYVEVFFNADALGVSANATAAAGALPAIPSVVFNVKQFR